MGSLFQGTPQTATSYTTTNTETPKWLQDAIYNQIQMATNVANTPYQPYEGPTVAELSPLQQQAYQQVQANQGAWQKDMGNVSSGLQNLANAPGGVNAASKYLQSAADLSGVNAASKYLQSAADLSGVNAAQPYMSSASNAINAGAGVNTAGDLSSAQGQYLRPGMVDTNLQAGQKYFGQAGTSAGNITSAAQPYLGQASNLTNQAAAGSDLTAANPYLQAARQSSVAGISQYMNPYQQNAMDVIAKQGARNLQENLLPAVSDAFIKAGQFGGTRMGEFGSRALRDTQESILNQQAQMANQGYGQALTASGADLARQAQLASTAGQLSSADLSRILQAGAQQGNLAQTAGGLTAQQASILSNLGQAQTTAGQAQQNFGLNAAQAQQQAQAADAARQIQAGTALANIGTQVGQLTNAQQSALANIGSQFGQLTNTDLARQQSALTAMGNAAQLQNQMRSADVAALEAAGQAQTAQQQKQLDAAQAQYQAGVNYPKQQLDWLNTQIRGMAPSAGTSTTQAGTTTGGTYSASPLSQIASGMALYKGLTS